MIPDPHMRRSKSGRPTTNRIHNEYTTQSPIGLKNVRIVETKVTIGKIILIDNNFLM